MRQRCKVCGKMRKRVHEAKMPCGFPRKKEVQFYDVPAKRLKRTIMMRFK